MISPIKYNDYFNTFTDAKSLIIKTLKLIKASNSPFLIESIDETSYVFLA